MEPKEPLRKREPVFTAAAVVAVVQNGLTMAATFGLQMSPEQTGASLMFTNSVAVLLGMVWTRRNTEAA